MNLETFEIKNARRLTNEDQDGYADGSNGFWLVRIDGELETKFSGAYIEDEDYPYVIVTCFEDVSGLLPKFVRSTPEAAEAYAEHVDGELV